MAQSLHDRIKGYEKSSEAYMAEVPAACAKGDREAVYHLLREYIRCRFVLVDDDFWSDDFDELSEYSIRKLLRLQKDEPLHDISMTCTGSSSVTTRKVLLLLTIQKKLRVQIRLYRVPGHRDGAPAGRCGHAPHGRGA